MMVNFPQMITLLSRSTSVNTNTVTAKPADTPTPNSDLGITFTQIATVSANITAFPDTGRSPLTMYAYQVRASNLAGDSDYSNTATAITFQ